MTDPILSPEDIRVTRNRFHIGRQNMTGAFAAKLTHSWDVFLTANVTQRARDKIMGGNAKTITGSTAGHA